jgi:hypothetical protein
MSCLGQGTDLRGGQGSLASAGGLRNVFVWGFAVSTKRESSAFAKQGPDSGRARIKKHFFGADVAMSNVEMPLTCRP